MSENIYHFFMSAATPSGFVTNFSELTDETRYQKAYLIKGGPGSGKSTLIKKAATVMGKKQGAVELIHCSADVSSMDAAVFHHSKTTILDATAPHVVNPAIPGVFERMVSLYDCFDNKKLKEFEPEIRRAKEAEEMCRKRFESLYRAAGMLLSSNESIAARCIDADKLSNFIARLCMRELKKPEAENSELRRRYLSSLTKDGVFVFTDTAEKLCDRLLVLQDDNGAVAGIILEGMCAAALSMGHTVYSCPCPMSRSGRIEHLFIPELRLGFMTSNKFHPIKLPAAKIIHTSRFIDKERMREYSFRASFQRRAARELLKEAAVFLNERLSAHQRLEEFYVKSCDFVAREALFDAVLSELA